MFTVCVVDTMKETLDRWVIMEYCEGGTMEKWLKDIWSKGEKVKEDVFSLFIFYVYFFIFHFFSLSLCFFFFFQGVLVDCGGGWVWSSGFA
jgi:serine/threonine protein kinase